METSQVKETINGEEGNFSNVTGFSVTQQDIEI